MKRPQLKLPPKLISNLFRYRMMIGMVFAVGLIGYVVYQITSLSNIQRDEEHYNQAVSNVKSFKFDEETINKIKNLEDPNVTVEPSLPEDRTNPF